MTEEHRKTVEFDELNEIVEFIKNTQLFRETVERMHEINKKHKTERKENNEIKALRIIATYILARATVEDAIHHSLDWAYTLTRHNAYFLTKFAERYMKEKKHD